MPEQEIGPYYIKDELLRSDITEGKVGVPLSLRLIVLDAHTCKPLSKVGVDVWHCDALGLYSGFTKQNPMGPGGPPSGFGPDGPPPGFDPQHPGNHPGPPEGMGPPPENHPTDKLTFLRGIQITNADGVVEFKTVFPGFYMGRTNHIHFRVRVAGQIAERTYRAGHTSHIGQIFFPENLATKLMGLPPYSEHHIHRTTQPEDDVYNDQHGEASMARVTFTDAQDVAAGVRAELMAAVDSTATPGPARRRTGASRFPGGLPPR